MGSVATAKQVRGVHWYKEVSSRQWTNLFASFLGFTLDGMDFLLYAMMLVPIAREFHLNPAMSGLLGSASLMAASIGGIVFGMLSDVWGRVRILTITVLVFSIASLGAAFSQTPTQLLLWRILLGLGMGGEWGAGALLITETWSKEHRSKAIGIMQAAWPVGYILAAIVAAIVSPHFGWRGVFAVGVLPALMVFWIRRRIIEPEIWAQGLQKKIKNPFAGVGALFRGEHLINTIRGTLFCIILLFAYQATFMWVPAFLATSAKLNIVRSAVFVIPMQIASILSEGTYGFVRDRLGTKWSVFPYAICAAIVIPLYVRSIHNLTMLLILGLGVGFFGAGLFSLVAVLLSELFPTAIRGTALGFCFNIGRMIGSQSPILVGYFAMQYGLNSAMAVTAIFFLLVGVCILFFPETKNRDIMA